MHFTAGRILSLVVAVAYALYFSLADGPAGDPHVVGRFVTVVLIGLALIWFPEQLGSFTSYVGRGGKIDTETPPAVLSCLGWGFLLGLPLILFHLSSMTD